MKTIGRYEVERELGRGAMGIVYLARDPRLRRQVALKTIALPEGLSAHQRRQYRQRFLREAQAAAALSHPGIVTVFDADEDPRTGVPFIAMEYVPGKCLRERLESGRRLTTRQACGIVAHLAGALEHAHAAGIVHRDIKPANILLGDDNGMARIVDFGIARMPTSRLTRPGASLGSPAYMSPEQIRGGEVDGRSDLFSLAVILYEMICGERPFRGEDLAELAYSIAHTDPVPITRQVGGLPAGLDRFFERALAKNRSARFADGGAFRAGLEATIRGEALAPAADLAATMVEGGAGPIAGIRTGPKMFMVAATLVALLMGGWWAVGSRRDVYLRLDARSSFSSGTLSLLVDGEEVYSHELAAEEGGFFKKVTGRSQEAFEAWIEIDPGKHEIVARVITADGTEFLESIVVDLEAGVQRELKLVAGRALGRPLSLKLD